MNKELPNSHSKEFNDGVGHAYRGEQASKNSEILKGDLKKKTISDLGRDALRQKQVSEEHLSDRRFAKAVDIFNKEELGEESHETESSLEKWAEATKAALAEKYAVRAEDFSLVESKNEDGEITHTVMMTAKSGIDLGDPSQEYDTARSYDTIEATQAGMSIGDEGEVIDFPTKEAYDAFIEGEIAKGTDPLPDSRDLALWTATWLKGKGTGSLAARFGAVDEGRPYANWIRSVYFVRILRFRPAVVKTK